MNQETLNKIQSISSIASAIAIPIVLAVAGWWVQSSMANEGIKKDYVQMAISILQSPEKQGNEELRKWAVAILDKNAPVKFTGDLREKLETGKISVYPFFPSPPAVLMKPPLELQPLPKKEKVTTGDLLSSVIENYGRCKQNALTFEYLQKWVNTMHEISNESATSDASPNKSFKADPLRGRP